MALYSLCLRLTEEQQARLMRLQAADPRAKAPHEAERADVDDVMNFHTADDLWRLFKVYKLSIRKLI